MCSGPSYVALDGRKPKGPDSARLSHHGQAAIFTTSGQFRGLPRLRGDARLRLLPSVRSRAGALSPLHPSARHAPRDGDRFPDRRAPSSRAHTWIQHLPEDQRPACGPSLDFLLSTFGPVQSLGRILRGSGECGKVDWTFLTFSIPEWTLAAFLAFAVWALFLASRD